MYKYADVKMVRVQPTHHHTLHFNQHKILVPFCIISRHAMAFQLRNTICINTSNSCE